MTKAEFRAAKQAIINRTYRDTHARAVQFSELLDRAIEHLPEDPKQEEVGQEAPSWASTREW